MPPEKTAFFHYQSGDTAWGGTTAFARMNASTSDLDTQSARPVRKKRMCPDLSQFRRVLEQTSICSFALLMRTRSKCGVSVRDPLNVFEPVFMLRSVTQHAEK